MCVCVWFACLEAHRGRSPHRMNYLHKISELPGVNIFILTVQFLYSIGEIRLLTVSNLISSRVYVELWCYNNCSFFSPFVIGHFCCMNVKLFDFKRHRCAYWWRVVEFNVATDCGEYRVMIPLMASFEPNTNANRPNEQTTIFLRMIQLHGPNPESQYVTNSIAT